VRLIKFFDKDSISFLSIHFFLNNKKDGFIRMDHLLEHRNLRNVTREQIFKIVENCSKKRFLIENFDGEPYIRANQGHSLKNIAVDMVEITESDNVDQCIHGTFYKSWDLIKKSVSS
jgi:2'-phosphotransferase